jgi:hypothetical protein
MLEGSTLEAFILEAFVREGPGAFQAGGMHARGLAVGHPAGAIYAGG